MSYPECSKGQGDKCAWALTWPCRCACAGANHGVARARAVRESMKREAEKNQKKVLTKSKISVLI